MNYIFFDGDHRESLLPFTFTRPVADIRIGILTVREKWERRLGALSSTLTEEYLQELFPIKLEKDNIFICGGILPDESLLKAIEDLGEGEKLISGDTLIAYRSKGAASPHEVGGFRERSFPGEIFELQNTWDIFTRNGEALEADFELLTSGRKSAQPDPSNHLINPDRIFLEPGARVTHSMLNASAGPIYIGKEAEVMEGSLIRGGFALGERGVVKMGAKIYGPTTAGPHCKIGGEINNSVFFAYSNKAHDGFLGNAVLGEWCNLGADSNNSNLKNNYAKVRLWNYATGNFVQTGLQFCGLIMGDHSKAAINTMFNTGTVIGVSCNIYTPGFPRNFVPGFSWGGASGFTTYRTERAFETAKVVMARRDLEFNEAHARMLSAVFEQTKQYRNYTQ